MTEGMNRLVQTDSLLFGCILVCRKNKCPEANVRAPVLVLHKLDEMQTENKLKKMRSSLKYRKKWISGWETQCRCCMIWSFVEMYDQLGRLHDGFDLSVILVMTVVTIMYLLKQKEGEFCWDRVQNCRETDVRRNHRVPFTTKHKTQRAHGLCWVMRVYYRQKSVQILSRERTETVVLLYMLQSWFCNNGHKHASHSGALRQRLMKPAMFGKEVKFGRLTHRQVFPHPSPSAEAKKDSLLAKRSCCSWSMRWGCCKCSQTHKHLAVVVDSGFGICVILPFCFWVKMWLKLLTACVFFLNFTNGFPLYTQSVNRLTINKNGRSSLLFSSTKKPLFVLCCQSCLGMVWIPFRQSSVSFCVAIFSSLHAHRYFSYTFWTFIHLDFPVSNLCNFPKGQFLSTNQPCSIWRHTLRSWDGHTCSCSLSYTPSSPRTSPRNPARRIQVTSFFQKTTKRFFHSQFVEIQQIVSRQVRKRNLGKPTRHLPLSLVSRFSSEKEKMVQKF